MPLIKSLLALLLLVVASGCGGDTIVAWPAYPTPSSYRIEPMLEHYALPHQGVIVPVGARVTTGRFLVIDLFVAVPSGSPGFPGGAVFENIFNGFAVFSAHENFTVEHRDGRDIKLLPIDLSKPGPGRPIDQYFATKFECVLSNHTVGFRPFMSSILAIPLECDAPPAVGETIRVRIADAQNRFGAKPVTDSIDLVVSAY